jgi:hypothetical protein
LSKSKTTFFIASSEGSDYESLSRSEVRRQIKEGSLKESRLIWNPAEGNWIPVKTMPHLLANTGEIPSFHPPQDKKAETMMIVAAPDRESYETIPRKALRKKLKEGTLKQSQLIWNEKESAWKPAAECEQLSRTDSLPIINNSADVEQIPSTPEVSIASVQPEVRDKAETSLLVATPDRESYEPISRRELRKQLREGSLKESRLIWDRQESAWKPAGACPELAQSDAFPALQTPVQNESRPVPQVSVRAPRPVVSGKAETMLIVATQDRESYASVTRKEIQRQMQEGTITETRLIWNNRDSAWKPAREIPELTQGEAFPTVHAVPSAQTVPSAQVASPAVHPVASAPSPRVASVSVKIARPSDIKKRSSKLDRMNTSRPSDHGQTPNREIKKKPRDKGFDSAVFLPKSGVARQIYKALSVIIILGLGFANYFFVHRPLVVAAQHSPFKETLKVSGHYARYVDPRCMVINFEEIPQNISEEKFIDLLTALAFATQSHRITTGVELQVQGEAKYLMSMQAWNSLVQHGDQSSQKRAKNLTYNFYLPNGKPAFNKKPEDLTPYETQDLFTKFYRTFVRGKPAEESKKK